MPGAAAGGSPATDVGEVLARLEPSSCLDIATGRGRSLAWVAGQTKGAGLLVGVDSSFRALSSADPLPDGRATSLLACDAALLPFTDGGFDLVSIVNSLHHFTDPSGVLREAVRMLSPRGRVLVSEMYRNRQHPARMTHVLMHSWWAEIDRLGGVPHFETFTRAGVLRLVRSAGLAAEVLDDDASGQPAMAGGEEVRTLLETLRAYSARIPPDHPRRWELERAGKRLEARVARTGFAPSAGVTVLCGPIRAGVKPGTAFPV